MKKVVTLFSLLIATAGFSQEPCSSGRYSSDVFSNVTVTSDVVYGSNTLYNGTTTSLTMDVYEPTNDTESARPLIIWAHGGSFIGGSKTDNDVVDLSNAFAKKGYVCASIEYRLGFFPLDSVNAVKAVVRAVQDMKAAIRYFYKDQADGINAYKIDTTRIYIGGSSAGAITALHVAYLDRSCEIDSYIDSTTLSTLGGIEGNSGNPCYSSTVAGVINLCGALAEYGLLEAGDIPVCSLHGTEDGTVKYNRGQVNPGIPIMYLDGSRMVHEQANAVGVQSNFYTFYGADHVPYYGTGATEIAYMDTTINFVRDFLIDQLGCTNAPLQAANTPYGTATLYPYTSCTGNVQTDFCAVAGIAQPELDEKLNIYPNPAENVLNIQWQQNQEMTIEVYDLVGKNVFKTNVNSADFQLERNGLKAGSYILKLTDASGASKATVIQFKN